MNLHRRRDRGFIGIGLIGAMISLSGLFLPSSNYYYVLGSFCLLLMAMYFHLVYFIALELILIAGHGSVFLHIDSTTQFVLPILLSIQLLLFYLLSGQWRNPYLLIGVTGIGALSLGFLYQNHWIFLYGSSTIALYSFSTRNPITFIWGGVNGIFASTVFIQICCPRLFFS